MLAQQGFACEKPVECAAIVELLIWREGDYTAEQRVREQSV
jgi:hypothetical protein